MPELTTIPEARLSKLKDGLTRIARDQALRTRIALLMDRLRELPGHETTVAELLQLVTDDLGGENATVFHRFDGGLYRTDVHGRNRVVGEVEDGLVRYVFETCESVSRGPLPGPTGVTTPEPPGVVTRVMPLLVGAELVGVLRFDELPVAGRDLCDEVKSFLPFLGLALENAVSEQESGRRSFDEASRSDRDRNEDGSGPRTREAELEQAKDELERRFAERNAELSRILEGTSSPVFSLNREYRYVAFNRGHALAMRALYGAEIEIGRSLLDYMTVARDRETARTNLDRALAGEQLLESAPSGEEPGSRRHYDVSHDPVLARDGSVIGVAVFAADVTERRRAEEDRLAHLRFFESLDLINRALQGTSDLEQMMSDVLDAVLEVFGCDRAWLVYPCDPASATYRVPMERTRPEYPGALARGLELPVDPETARVLQAVSASSGPVTFGPGSQEPLPTVLSERFRVQSQIAVAVHPRVSLPYVFGLHQCSFRRNWTPDDGKLLQEIGRRLGDALTSLRTYRDLEGSEKRYRTLIQRIQAAVVVHGADTQVVASNRKAQELLGLSEDQLLGRAVTDRAWQFFRADGSVIPPEEFPAYRVCVTRQPLKDLVARIHRSGKDGASDVWVLVNADPVLGRDGEVSQVIVTFSDITELKRAEGRLHREAERGSLLLDLFLRSPQLSEKQVYDGVLELAVRLTGSAIGFLHRVSEDQKTVSLTTWNEAALESCSAVFDSHYPIEKAGNWVDGVRLDHPVIYNDYAASPNQKGLPAGHAPLQRFMSVPVVEEGVIRIVFGVGNKAAEYDEDDVFQIQQIAAELQKLIRQRHAVERVEFLGRLYRTVSEMNQVIVREKSRDRLFAEVCRIGVEHGGFAMVWAGLADLPGGTVRPAGSAGPEAGYVDKLEIRLDVPSAELRPAARAVVENRAVVVDDTDTDPGFALWREAAQKRQFRSCAAFPVRADGCVLGVLAVYAGEAGVFQGEVVALLGELAADLGFTLRALETDELRARAEQALRAERGLFVGGPTVVFNWKAREGWPVEYVSPNVTQQLGYSPEDFTSGRVLYAGIVHPDDLARVGAEVSAFGEQGVPSFEQTYRVRRSDGCYRWIHDFTTVCRGGDGTITHYHGYVLDITERRAAEGALRESEERYRLIAENTADTITVMDLDLRLTYMSPAVLKHRGYTAEEATAQSLEQILTPTSLQAASRLLDEQTALEASGGADPSRSTSIELEEYCKDGSTIWVEAAVSFLRDGALRPTGILAVTRDITKRKMADQRLIESEQQYRSLADSSPDNIVRYDADARLVYVNRNMDVSVGFDLGSRLGLTPAEGAPGHGVEAYEEKLRRVIQSGEPDELEVTVPNPAGELRTHSIRFVAERNNDGRIIGALAFGRDITERKEAAREKQKYLVQLRQNLEDAVAAIAATVEARDPYTAGHQKRVAALAAEMARELGLDEETVQGIHLAGTIHDLGKIKIPAEILARPGGLSALEARLIRIHPEAGWEILKGVEFPWPIAEMVLEHHERQNGSGYPRGLRGEQISLGARILAVADVVEAMASHRPYRPSRELSFALSDIEGDREGCFDPVVVKACLTLFRDKGYQLPD
jgi:PAS domain S-box-containing protein/putative nucleotidyltransferase with HDIG domain